MQPNLITQSKHGAYEDTEMWGSFDRAGRFSSRLISDACGYILICGGGFFFISFVLSELNLRRLKPIYFLLVQLWFWCCLADVQSNVERKKKEEEERRKKSMRGGKLNSDIQKSLSLLSGAIDSGIYHFTTQAKSYISRKPCIASLTKHSTDIRLIVFN